MNDIINAIAGQPASTYYHTLAFVGTAFLTQYSVQIVKILTKYRYSKNILRFLNGAFNTLFVAAAAWATGGITIGHLTVYAAALSSFSAIIYRIHNNLLYKELSGEVSKQTETPQFASN